jgi:hypothetical protein
MLLVFYFFIIYFFIVNYMAIINSVVIGDGKNRVGEVTLSTVFGRTIARKYQGHVRNPRSEGQVAQRSRMFNVQLIYHGIKPVIRDGFLQKDRLWSVYNAFVSASIGSMSDRKELDSAQAIVYAVGDIVTSKGSLTPVSLTVDGYGQTVVFGSAAKEMSVGDRLVYGVVIEDGTIGDNTVLPISREMIDDGSVTFDPPASGVIGYIYYWYSADRKRVSTQVMWRPQGKVKKVVKAAGK